VGVAFQRAGEGKRQAFSAPLDEDLEQLLQRLEETH